MRTARGSQLAGIRAFQRQLQDAIVKRNPVMLEKRAEFFTELFENQLPKAAKVLDIGGGWGFYAEPLRRRGHHLTVLDVVKPGYQRAPVILYDPQSRIPFPDKSFDASLFITVLHHISDLQKVIAEAIRVTRSKIIVVEDLYRNSMGRIWTILRDCLYNFEFFGHPCQFKKKEEWIRFFEKMKLKLAAEKEVYTYLAGLRILNGLMIFEPDPK